jgi:predicted DCC family thiol-disulfide oxidoreductase YuxK
MQPDVARSTQPDSAREGGMLPILLYDGTCGLCARSVQFVLRNERRSHKLRFATLQGPHGAAALRSNPDLATVDSVIWLEPGVGGAPPRVLVRSDAVLAVLRHLGGAWAWLAAVGRIVPRVSRDFLYRIVARYRYRVFGRDQSCLLPTPEQRARFLG